MSTLTGIAALCAAASGAPSAGSGAACCPRVTSEHNADTTDLKRFRNFAPWKDKQGQDLAVAIWQYLTDYETGLYHFYEVMDGPDPFGEYATMREPLKMLNVYNMGYCGIFGPTAEGIFHGCGFETGRSFGVAAWSHCATELFYDKAWHYFDVDVRGLVLRPDGRVASLDEVRKNKQWWMDSVGKVTPFFPKFSGSTAIAQVADIYARSEIDLQYRWWQGSHTADWSLRPGESFTRWWDDQTGRWNHFPRYNKEQWVRELIRTPPAGMKPNHRDFTRWNHGGGLFHYAPSLKASSGDFAAGALSAKGVAPGPDGLVLTTDAGEAVFEVFTPFVIVPKVNDVDKESDDSHAATIAIAAPVPVTVQVSTDNGLSWADAGTATRAAPMLDLTGYVKGRYGYQVKLVVRGKKGDSVIHALTLDTWVQVAPVSLPRLKRGVNRLRYDVGDRYDAPSQPVLILPNVADREDLKKYVAELPKDYEPERVKARIRGEAVFRFADPAGRKIAWLSVGGTFATHRGQAAAQTANRMAYAVDRPRDFREVYKADVPTWTEHWRYNFDTDIRLEQPAEAVYVKVVGDPGVNVVRACLHVVPPRSWDPGVKITHGYRIGGRDDEKTVNMSGPGSYTVECDGDVENVFVKVEKPSSVY